MPAMDQEQRDETNRLLGQLVEGQTRVQDELRDTKSLLNDMSSRIRHMEENKADSSDLDKLAQRVTVVEHFRTRVIMLATVVTGTISVVGYTLAQYLGKLMPVKGG